MSPSQELEEAVLQLETEMKQLLQCTVWLLIFEGDLFSLFSRCIHDLRKLKKYQNFDPKNADSAMAKFSS